MATEGTVPSGAVCAACPAIQANIATLLTRQADIAESVRELKDCQKEIFALMRENNGKTAKTREEVALIAAQVKGDTVRAGLWWSGGIYVGLTALWEMVKRGLHL